MKSPSASASAPKAADQWKTRVLSALLVLPMAAWACGIWLPNRLLSDGGSRLLDAPESCFADEVERMTLSTSTHQTVTTTNRFLQESTAGDLDELRLALKSMGRSREDIERVVAEHARERAALEAAVDAAAKRWSWPATPPTNPPPVFAPGSIRVVAGLPGEFADYFEGALAWHNGETNRAITAWERLLQRPPAQRRWRSTWAAFMLGKARWETEPRKAIASFRETRNLATNGFADRLGLAACSLGWEARAELHRDEFARAIGLYLEQSATGDPSAMLSLRFAARAALENPGSLVALARHPKAQRVITAYVISGGSGDPPVDVDNPIKEAVVQLLDQQSIVAAPTNGWHRFESPTLLWLQAVEKARVQDVDSAEKLALAAYQAGEYNRARRWLDLARDQPVARWLNAKLALRDGRIDQATTLLSSLVRQFPALAPGPSSTSGNPDTHPGPDTNLGVAADSRAARSIFLLGRIAVREREGVPEASHQMLGELGALHLARRDYTEALDALIRGGCWTDAAYVADRVLTIDELRTYVDRAWPPFATPASSPEKPERSANAHDATPGPEIDQEADATDSAATVSDPDRQVVRNWLALRFIRAQRPTEARAYLRRPDRPALDDYVRARSIGADLTRPAGERAAILWQAAQSVWKSELNLFTPPVETDWHVSGGFSYSNTPTERLAPPTASTVLPASTDEIRRVSATGATNSTWYYRYIAADLAWQAATLMPDQSNATAKVLWQAGTWLKTADPNAADRFYKALVRRCRNTAIGREADRKRWFPTETFVARVAQ